MFDKDKLMEVNGVGCVFNMPNAVSVRKDDEGNELPVGLPPHCQIKPYAVDEYPGCPDAWMHGSSKASSYFVPVKEDKGMWLDFNSCWNHKHDVAVVLSIQGVNPISGQKQDKMVLEQYRNKCPLHDCNFQQDRFCPECKMTWPAQSYVSTTGSSENHFWIDGFRNADGQVRQYIFSAEEMKGIAAQIIGKDRVFAIGIAFFLSKKPHGRIEAKTKSRSIVMDYSFPVQKLVKKSQFPNKYHTDETIVSCSASDDYSMNSMLFDVGACEDESTSEEETRDYGEFRGMSIDKPVETKLEIGAGGLIDQQVDLDPKDPDYWENEPVGFIYINYSTQKEFDKILAIGKRKEKKDGFMDGLKVGVRD